MSDSQSAAKYVRRVTPIERLFTRSPFSIVTVVAKIKGDVSEGALRNALSKVQLRHLNLRVRIVEDENSDPWFTSEGAKEIPIEIVPRESEAHWARVVQEASQRPFEFDERPPIRFILVQSPATSELIILCHHIICDGLSLAYLARDVMEHLGDPDRSVTVLPDPILVGRDSIPSDISTNGIVRFLINRMNKKWEAEKIVFDQADYRELHKAYWDHYEHQMLPVELSEAQTTALVGRCRKNGVTVNSALAAAFLGGQVMIQGQRDHHKSIGVAGSLRDRLQTPAGEAMGFFAGVVTLKFKYNSDLGFWKNAQQFHRKVRPLYTDKKLFADPLTWCHLDPTILEAINFKKLGGLVSPNSLRYEKLSNFSRRNDVVLRILRRDGLDSLEQIAMGTAVTNLTKLDFPTHYGELELDRLIMKPGGAFPLVNVNLVLGAVTCSGRLSLALEYATQTVDTATIMKINDRALALLLNE
jgi:hypothetical protein